VCLLVPTRTLAPLIDLLEEKMLSRSFLAGLVAVLLATLVALPAAAQSLTSGDVAGVITDPSGAAVSNAAVTLKNNDTGSTQVRNTSPQGAFRFQLLQPGTYTVSVSAQGFQTRDQVVAVTVGQASTVNLQLAVGTATQTVEVTAEGGTVQTENANISTTFSSSQVANVPNPGNDLSYIVQTSPGAVMNTQGGFGNSSHVRSAGDFKPLHRKRNERERSVSEPEQLRRHQSVARTERH